MCTEVRGEGIHSLVPRRFFERPSGLGFRITMLIEPPEIHTDYISCIIKPYANKLHGSSAVEAKLM